MNSLWNEFDRLVDHLETLKLGSEEYDACLEQLNKIDQILQRVQPPPKPLWEKLLSNQALVTGAFGALGTIAVISSERIHVITSRAFSWIKWK